MRKSLVLVVALSLVPTVSVGQPATGQRLFASPEEAVTALVAAARADDDKALVEIFGAKHADLIVSPEKAYREHRAQFAKAAGEFRVLRTSADGRVVTLIVGYDAWPFPIPLVKEGSAWRFDTEAGREQALIRRIGQSELGAIAALRAYVEAQRQYASKPRDGVSVRQFARKIRSAPGKHDGLYWDADPAKGEEPSPFGPLIGDARGRKAGEAYHGYFYKILTRQGAAAPAGRYDYVINGWMVAGYAMVAYPAAYGRSGIKTFIVNHYGVVYEKDLGAGTARIASSMTEYNPDRSWKETQ